MTSARVLATQRARDAAKQLLALTGPLKEQVRTVLQHGSILADTNQWNGSLAGIWRNDWGRDANQLNRAVAKLDELGRRAHQVVEDIFKADGVPLAAGQRNAGRRPHDDLLEKYQVSPDPDGMTEWPLKLVSKVVNKVGGLLNRVPLVPDVPRLPSMKVTATEADMLAELQISQGLRGTAPAYDIYQEALHRAENTFEGKGLTDGHADAFRHAYWNAMLRGRFGEEWTREYATTHERNPKSHPIPVAMDLHNNEVGRRIARENPDADWEELRRLVEQAQPR